MVGSVEEESQDAVGNLGGGESLGKELERDDKSGIGTPVAEVKSDVVRRAFVLGGN